MEITRSTYARKALEDGAPSMTALDLDRQVSWKDPGIEKIMAAARAGTPGTVPSPGPEPSPAKAGPAHPGKGALKPQDLLNDGTDHIVRNGVKIRKGTIAAFIVDAATFSAPLNPEERAAARRLLVELAPGLVALDMDRVASWKDPEIQGILTQARTELGRKPHLRLPAPSRD